tara:strand:+ start:346 stop:468 length:123 start_codon:yes stop_codon:yes gene_type:complete
MMHMVYMKPRKKPEAEKPKAKKVVKKKPAKKKSSYQGKYA